MKAFIATVVIAVLFAGLLAATSQGQAERTGGWSEDALALAAKIPIQEGGRIKPLGTYARFKLLSLNGRSSLKLPDGRKLSAMEWLLDSIFIPERTQEYKVFLVQNSEVLDAIGLDHVGKKKRDRYSYKALAPGRMKLMQLAGEYSRGEGKDRTTVERQIIALAINMRGLEQLMEYAQFGTERFSVVDGPAVAALFESPDRTTLSQVLARAADLRRLSSESREKPDGEADSRAISRLVQAVNQAAGRSTALALFPPSAPRAEVMDWMDPATLSQAALFAGADVPLQIGMLSAMEGMASVVGQNPPDFRAFDGHLAVFHDNSRRLADSRGEYAKVELEDKYYRSGILHWSLGFFVIGFLLVAVTWLAPRVRVLYWASGVPLLIALVALVAAITMRCVIRSRPPVTTLYETILFITAVVVFTGMVVEVINRKRIALAAVAILGVLGLFIAGRYEISKGVDTMPTLVAVLDTNFWLTTHVTTIAIGYGGGLLAALIAHFYIFGLLLKRVFGLSIPGSFFHSTARMVYGVTAFGLLFAIVGTLLGGIWANESWGRFWGWDPKENGALMICLWMLIMLHARSASYIRGLGLSITAVFCGIVVAFSWWGVNLLGVGLHTYGFEGGIALMLNIFYAVEAVVMLLGGLAWLLGAISGEAAASSAAEQAAGAPASAAPVDAGD